jgi:hypothetical protein
MLYYSEMEAMIMKKMLLMFVGLLGAMVLGGCVTVAYHQTKLPTGQVLSTHKTVARYIGLTEVPCRHMTAQCPNECEHGGVYAQFVIEQYKDYIASSEYAEERQETFAVRLWLRNGEAAPEGSIALRQVVGELKAGQQVQLDWVQFYHITETCNYPENIVIRLAE